MASNLVCDGEIVIAPSQLAGPPQAAYFVNGVYEPVPMPVCLTGWRTTQAFDFQDLVALLQFDPEIFSLLFGTCVLTFVIGHFAGHVARNLARK